MTKSSNYNFYISLNERKGLTVGQHVYVEEDVGQLEDTGEEIIELSKHMIVDANTDDPYVWADDGHGHLEKRKVMLGDFNKKSKKYRVVEGLSMEDLLAQPDDGLVSGIRTVNMDEQDEEDLEESEDEDSEDKGSEEEEDELGDAVFE